MYRLRDVVKKEYSLLISREGGSIVFEASNSLYLLVPKTIREKLERDFKIDLRHNREGIMIKCDLMLEPQGTVNLVYGFWKKEGEESPQTLPAVDRERWRNKKNGSSG